MASNTANTFISGVNIGGTQIGQANVNNSLDRRSIIRDWLSTQNPAEKQHAVLADRHPGTVQWFLDLPAFKQWHTGTRQTLWCHGIPGSGKTVLTATVIDHLSHTHTDGQERPSVAYYYFDHLSRKTQSARDVLASLWRQLDLYNKDFTPTAEKIYEKHQDFRTKPTLEEVSAILQCEVTRHSKVYIIVDALDEYDDTVEVGFGLIDILRNLLTTPANNQSSVRLLVTSRVQDSVFSGAEVVQYRAKAHDIKAVVSNRIAEGLCRNKELAGAVREDTALRDKIIDGVAARADGLFLQARLYVNSLYSKINKRNIRESLNVLPPSLDKLYDDAWSRVKTQDSDNRRLAHQVLCWLTHSLRRVTLIELRHALAVRMGDPGPDPEGLDLTDAIVSSCQSLATLDAASRIIRLVHSTAEDYFERNRVQFFGDAHSDLSKICLTYLMFDVFAQGPCEFESFRDVHVKSGGRLGQRIAKKRFLPAKLKRYPFLGYAAYFWGHHARKATRGINQINQILILRLLQSPGHRNSAAQILYNLSFHESDQSSDRPDYGALHLVFVFGLEDIMATLLKCSGSIQDDCKNLSEGIALQTAMVSGNTRLAQLLLEKGANISSLPEHDRNVLYEAVMQSFDTTVQSFLQFHPEALENFDLVIVAVLQCAKSALQSYIDAGTLTTTRADRASTILLISSTHGQAEAARLALSSGADIEAKDKEGRTALFIAILNRRDQVCKILLEAGASTNIYAQDEKTLLQVAIGSCEVFKERLQLIRDHTRGEQRLQPSEGTNRPFKSQLNHWIASEPDFRHLHRRPNVLTILKEDSSQVEIIELLLTHGCRPTPTADGETLLHLSICTSPGAKYLMELGSDFIDMDAQDRNGRTALHYAAAAGNAESMEVIMSHNANVALHDFQGVTLLHFSVNFPACTRLALEAGALLHLSDNLARTPLCYAALVKRSDTEVIGLLKEAGARTGTVDYVKTANQYLRDSKNDDDHISEEVIDWIENAYHKYPLHMKSVASWFRKFAADLERAKIRRQKEWSLDIESAKTWELVSDTDDEDCDQPLAVESDEDTFISQHN